MPSEPEELRELGEWRGKETFPAPAPVAAAEVEETEEELADGEEGMSEASR